MASTIPHSGDLMRIREGRLPDVKTREWTFLWKTPNNVILVSYKDKGRILKVIKEDDIDWKDYQEKNSFRLSPRTFCRQDIPPRKGGPFATVVERGDLALLYPKPKQVDGTAPQAPYGPFCLSSPRISSITYPCSRQKDRRLVSMG